MHARSSQRDIFADPEYVGIVQSLRGVCLSTEIEYVQNCFFFSFQEMSVADWPPRVTGESDDSHREAAFQIHSDTAAQIHRLQEQWESAQNDFDAVVHEGAPASIDRLSRMIYDLEVLPGNVESLMNQMTYEEGRSACRRLLFDLAGSREEMLEVSRKKNDERCAA